MESIEEIYIKYANLIKNYIYTITNNTELSEEIMQAGKSYDFQYKFGIDMLKKIGGM